jgi:hypothetical protein
MKRLRWTGLSGGTAPFVEYRPIFSVAGDEGFSDALAERTLGRQQPKRHYTDVSSTGTLGRESGFLPALRDLLSTAAGRARVLQQTWRSS